MRISDQESAVSARLADIGLNNVEPSEISSLSEQCFFLAVKIYFRP